MSTAFDQSFEHDVHHSQAGQQILKAYDFLDEIYRSDQSVLYKVTHIDSKGLYVLKGIRKHHSFTFSVETVKKIDSPLINKIVEFYESDYYLYLIEDFVDGVNLEQYVAQGGILPEAAAMSIILEVARALCDLHLHGNAKFVFRDLKPSNIMIRPSGDIVLIDVITIREIKERKTQDTYVIGTKGYTAPEAYGFMQTSEQSDIFSLGATLFFLLTAKQPANIQSFSDQLQENAHVAGYLRSIIEKSTAFNPKDRFENVHQFIGAIQSKKISGSKKKAGVYALSVLALVITGVLITRLPLVANDNHSDINGSQQVMSDSQQVTNSIVANIPYKIEEKMTRDQFKISSLECITKGVNLVLYDNDVINITFDRALLSDKVKDFAYISVSTSLVPLSIDQWSQITYTDW